MQPLAGTLGRGDSGGHEASQDEGEGMEYVLVLSILHFYI